MSVDDFLLIVVFSIATWRISSLITQEDGPLDIFAKFRSILGVKYDVNSNPYGDSNLARGILCVWCVSVWVAFPIAYLFAGTIGVYNRIYIFMYWLAISGIAIIVNSIIEWLRHKNMK